MGKLGVKEEEGGSTRGLVSTLHNNSTFPLRVEGKGQSKNYMTRKIYGFRKIRRGSYADRGNVD